jgi:hypothetical protein
MAIEPFRQRIGIPDGAGVTSQGVGRVADLSNELSGLAGTAMQIMEPRLKRRAQEQAVQDAARTLIGKDENGNYVMPDTPAGAGDVYAATFDGAKREQYKLAVLNDAELQFNQIYSDPANIGKPPEEMRLLAENVLSGIMGAVDPFVETEIYENLTREIRQRDLAANNAWLRQETELMEKGFASKVSEATEKATEAFANGSEEDGAREAANGRAALQQLVNLRRAPREALDAFDRQFESVRAAGLFLRDVRADLGEGTLFADDLQKLQSMLDGTSDETVIVGGKEYTGDALRALIPDTAMRTQLMAKLNRREAELLKDEAARAAEDEAIGLMAGVPMGGNRPYGVSDEQWTDAWTAWATQEGVDLMSPEGVTRAFHRSPDLPEGLYKRAFANMSARTPQELERILPLYQTMQNMLGRDGQTVPIAEGLMDPDDSAFLYHYSAARRMQAAPQDAAARARTAVAAKVGMPSDQLRAMLRERGGYKDNTVLFDKLDDEVGVNWEYLNARAQDAIQLDVAQQVAMGVDLDTARKSAGLRFKAGWEKQTFSLESAIQQKRGRGNAWVEKGATVPKIMDPRNPREKNDGWVTNYVQEAIRQWGGTQLPGVPAAKDLMFGTNVWLQPTGRRTTNGGTQFALMYWDPEKGNAPTALMNKQGVPIQLEFDRAAKKQQLHLESEFKRRSERASMRTPSTPVTYMPGSSSAAGNLLTPSPATLGLRYAPVQLDDVAPPGLERGLLTSSANNWPGVARALASRYGLRPEHVAAVISYETGGKFDPDVWGGKNNNHFGLIQFGAAEREKHLRPLLGKRRFEDATPQEWATAIGSFLDERGFKRGMSVLDLYSTINAGRPGLYNRSDNGGKDTVRSHVQRMLRDHVGPAKRWLATG